MAFFDLLHAQNRRESSLAGNIVHSLHRFCVFSFSLCVCFFSFFFFFCCCAILKTISEEPLVLRGTQYWNLVSVEVQREDGTHSRVTGAVFGNQPHIVQVIYFLLVLF